MNLKEKSRVILNIKGIVQGVGFRPFVYNLAVKLGLKGWVMNGPGGVTIDAEGSSADLEDFKKRLLSEAPPLSYIEVCHNEEMDVCGHVDFTIQPSVGDSFHDSYISPDIAVCEDCLKEMRDPEDRRYGYPFVNCTNCGPRFTITKGIPYDRVNTTMSGFVMCEECRAEYQDPLNRRFHAQPVACPKCGPEVLLMDRNRKPVECRDYIAEARALLNRGNILAIKGLGGYHLACDATNIEAVKKLRLRKERDGKPFALMVKDMGTASFYCHINKKERELLEGIRRPIVLLERKQGDGIPIDYLSPDNNRLGLMLPYTPLHHLLFEEDLKILVMTSGNRSGEPIYYRDEDALEGLGGIADYFLVHNREIHIRTDDSVTSAFGVREYIIRRSRGYVPYPVSLRHVSIQAVINGNGKADTGYTVPPVTAENQPVVLACGGELKSTFCLVKNGNAFLSHHIGDLENLETLKSFEEGIGHFESIFAVKPDVIAYDSHPEYLSTKYALDRKGCELVPVQHHEAHIASCMAENNLSGPVIGIAFDGTGYGNDGRIWGGEFFTGDYDGFDRAAHIEYMPMPGGAKCIEEPWRLAFAYLYEVYGERVHELGLPFLKEYGDTALRMLQHQLLRGINTPVTSSMGRLFDAISAMLGLCSRISYEGEAAIKLEKAADMSVKQAYGYEITKSGINDAYIINIRDLIMGIVNDIIKGKDTAMVSGGFHQAVINFSVDICEVLRVENGISKVALSGGVFQNRLLLEGMAGRLEEKGFTVYTHGRVPANDGGIALGQAAVALRRSIYVPGSTGKNNQH